MNVFLGSRGIFLLVAWSADRNFVGLNSDTTFSPLQLPIDDLSSIFYAFADVAPDGTVSSSNPVVDTQFQFTKHKFGARAAEGEEDEPHQPEKRQTGGNVSGAVEQLFNFKQLKRSLKVILVVGGGNDVATANITDAASTAVSRANFAATATKLITDWGMDGIGIDYEFPSSQTEAANYLALITAVRAAFDNYSRTYGLNYQFHISTSISADPTVYQYLDLPALAPLVNNWYVYSSSPLTLLTTYTGTFWHSTTPETSA